MGVEGDTYDFQVQLGFGKSQFFHLQGIYVTGVLNVLVNDGKVWLLSNLVCNDDDSIVVRSDIIDKNVGFGISQ